MDSAALYFDLTQDPYDIEDMALFRRVVRAVFNQRRKMLRNSLRALLAPNMLDCIDSIALNRRPESLSVNEFKVLYQTIKKLVENG